jgi:hypothetical protein
MYREEQRAREAKHRAAMLGAESMRAGGKRRVHCPPPPEQRMSLFWQVFGGTILSVVALVMITAYNQMTSAEADLRRDINQIQADIVRKDELNTRLMSLWNSIKELEQTRLAVASLSEQAKVLGKHLDSSVKADADERRELQRRLDELSQRLHKLAERLASVEATPRPFDFNGTITK